MNLGLILYKDVILPGNPIVEVRRSYDHLISTLELPILVRWHLYIELGLKFLYKTPSLNDLLLRWLQPLCRIYHKTCTLLCFACLCCGYNMGTTVKSLIYGTPNPKTYMILVLFCICLCPIYWSQVLSREWRCSWSSAGRRCSNYIWVINNLVAY